jgi:putative transposase
MPHYHRYYLPNHPVFITCVTHDREKLFSAGDNIDLLWQIVHQTKERIPFNLAAYVILPDHFHWLLELPEEQPNFSTVIRQIKWKFTIEYRKFRDVAPGFSPWQKRFWDHVIRDETDLETHVDYIHWNPLRHGLVNAPEDWGHSSFRKWVKEGYYEGEWGRNGEPDGIKGLRYE